MTIRRGRKSPLESFEARYFSIPEGCSPRYLSAAALVRRGYPLVVARRYVEVQQDFLRGLRAHVQAVN